MGGVFQSHRTLGVCLNPHVTKFLPIKCHKSIGYTSNYSHLIGIIWSFSIGALGLGVHYFQTNPNIVTVCWRNIKQSWERMAGLFVGHSIRFDRFDPFDARLANDAYEKNCGMIFEYGHTVSHAIEKARLHQRGSNQDGVAMPRWWMAIFIWLVVWNMNVMFPYFSICWEWSSQLTKSYFSEG